jgi:hypothetical protein
MYQVAITKAFGGLVGENTAYVHVSFSRMEQGGEMLQHLHDPPPFLMQVVLNAA